MGLFLGTSDADTLRGTDTADIITGFGGDDFIFGLGGLDVIDGGTGNDMIYANSQTRWSDDALDTVLAGAGDDHVHGGYGDILNGGTGFDLLSLDLSSANQGIQVDFRPMTLLDLTESLVLAIDGTQLSGFQAVTDVHGSNFDDRIIVGNRGGVGSRIEGRDGDDSIRANNAADNLDGGAGDDRLSGLRGQDTLTGGNGADAFVFNDRDSARGRERADTITDFSQSDGDKISLAGIDAVRGGDVNERFTFIGDDRFSGTAGELRFNVVGNSTFVSGDTDGDARPDFTIRIEDQVTLVQADFVL